MLKITARHSKTHCAGKTSDTDHILLVENQKFFPSRGEAIRYLEIFRGLELLEKVSENVYRNPRDGCWPSTLSAIAHPCREQGCDVQCYVIQESSRHRPEDPADFYLVSVGLYITPYPKKAGINSHVIDLISRHLEDDEIIAPVCSVAQTDTYQLTLTHMRNLKCKA